MRSSIPRSAMTFTRFIENCAQDRRVIEALESVLKGSDTPLIVTSGLSGLARGALESDLPNAGAPRQSEPAARLLAERGIRAATVRLAPSVHGVGDHGFLPILIRLARQTGVSAYIGDGENCWSGVYRSDAARVYRLALEEGVSQAVYHAVADEAVPDMGAQVQRDVGGNVSTDRQPIRKTLRLPGENLHNGGQFV